MLNLKLSFKAKLIALCAFLSGVSMLIGWISYRGLHKVEQSYDQVVDGVMPNLNLLNSMFIEYRAVRINLRTLGLPSLPKEEEQKAVADTLTAIENYEKLDKAYNDIPFLDGEKELYDDVDKAWKHFKGVGERVLSLHKTGRPEDHQAMLKIFFEDCPQAAANYRAAINKIKKFHEENGKRYVSDAKTAGTDANQLMLLTIFCGVLFGMALGVIFAVRISKAVMVVAKDLERNADSVTSASTQIAASSEELSNASTEQAASLQETASSLEEITTMIAKASTNAKSSATSSASSQEKAEKGRVAMERMLTSIGEISDSNTAIMTQVNESNQKMADIVKVIQEIGNKTKVINEIVFQTKLLSFNASVEAARAGEHGKGFAVVAEEVGNLAQMSGNAAKEISDMLNNSIPKVEAIVQDTKTRVETLIEQAKEKVGSGVSVAQECSTILNEIVQNVSQVATLASEISTANEEQSLGVNEINKAIAQLDIVTQENTTASRDTATAAESLSVQAVELRNAVKQLVETIEGSESPKKSGTQKSAALPNNVIPLRKPETAKPSPAPRKMAVGQMEVPDRFDSGFEDV